LIIYFFYSAVVTGGPQLAGLLWFLLEEKRDK